MVIVVIVVAIVFYTIAMVVCGGFCSCGPLTIHPGRQTTTTTTSVADAASERRYKALSAADKQQYAKHVQSECARTSMCVQPQDLGESHEALLEETQRTEEHRVMTPANYTTTRNELAPWSQLVWNLKSLIRPAALPWLRLTPGMIHGNRCVPNECAICLEPYQPNEKVTWSSSASLPCPHAFHTYCIQKHAYAVIENDRASKKDGIPCPLCRQPFVGPARLPPPRVAHTPTTPAVANPNSTPNQNNTRSQNNAPAAAAADTVVVAAGGLLSFIF